MDQSLSKIFNFVDGGLVKISGAIRNWARWSDIVPVILLDIILRNYICWAYQWKMNFNPDPNKQAQEVIFSWKTKKQYHPPLALNNNNVSETNSQKHLGVVLDNRLSFEEHLKMILNKVNKTIGLLRKLHNTLARSALLTIYKSFSRPHLDYGDIIYDQVYNASFHQKLELLQ